MKSKNLLGLGLGIAIVSILCKPTSAESEQHPSEIVNLPDGYYFYSSESNPNGRHGVRFLFHKHKDKATGAVSSGGGGTCFTGFIRGNKIVDNTIAYIDYAQLGSKAGWTFAKIPSYDLSKFSQFNLNRYRGSIKSELASCEKAFAQIKKTSLLVKD